MATEKMIAGFEEEFAGVSLGDARLDKRLAAIAERLGAVPDDSFPDQMASVAEREALYRFLSNSKVTLDAVLAPHIAQTADRISKHRCVRVVHDTTAFTFDGEREGLDVLQLNKKGFFGHVALAVTDDETREPLGVLGVRTHVHKDIEAKRGKSRSQRVAALQRTPREEKESCRWEQLAIDVSQALPAGVHAIHVMDREADCYDVMAALVENNLGFVVRVKASRKTGDRVPVRDLLAKRPTTIFRNIRVTPRPARQVSTIKHPARTDREAELSIRWGVATLHPQQFSSSRVAALSLNAVHVFESAPPEGQEPIEWMLFTSQPVTDLEQAIAVVDHYRARWMIEEFFKALKTGCAFEKRQLTSLDTLVRALALFVPLAWRLLLLRHLGRTNVSLPASATFDREQLLLLRALLEKRDAGYSFPEHPSVRDAMLAIAHLGGHIRNNGDPGWQVLGRGFTRFVEAEAVWRLARGCDQS
jgi:hypothetical protein